MTSAFMPTLCAAGESHCGCVRERNEDNFCYVSLYPGYLLAAVCDGVGGHTGGDVASYLCCHRLVLDWKKLFSENPTPPDALMGCWLHDTLQRANLDVFAANYEKEKKNQRPMCTTAAVAVFTPQMAIVAHVGDSRVYCLRNNICRQLTCDHTLQNELSEKGMCDSGRMPGAHIISRAVGSGPTMKVELHTYFRSAQDRYLICSDGLSYCWSDAELGKVMQSAKTPREATDRFIRDTLRRGAGDNVTAICVFPENIS
ncbi:MAG: serine/threonine-protein phosphatase [Lentisphaerae bacterium]|nr:serine/threonine-protein phosphatase [Lentisphaerota bacterium]